MARRKAVSCRICTAVFRSFSVPWPESSESEGMRGCIRGSTRPGVASICRARTLPRTYGNGCPPPGFRSPTRVTLSRPVRSIRSRCASAAIHRVQKDRESVEQALALEWVRRKDTPLVIDGGISNSEPVAKAATAIGVVKSHRTMYATGQELATVLALTHAERSSVFLVTSPKRAAVRSWYLRLREQSGGDPMWGLVRVEALGWCGRPMTPISDEWRTMCRAGSWPKRRLSLCRIAGGTKWSTGFETVRNSFAPACSPAEAREF